MKCDTIHGKGKPAERTLYVMPVRITIEKKSKLKFTPRLKGYTAVLVILTGILVGNVFFEK